MDLEGYKPCRVYNPRLSLGLVVAGDVQPLIETRTREPIKSKGNAYLSGVLIYRFIIRVIGFIFFPPRFVPAATFTTSVTQNVRS
jgi:hypothetical protein